MKETDELLINTGRCFARPIIVLGYIIIILGIASIFSLISGDYPILCLTGIIPILIGSFLSFNMSGFQIRNNQYRSFCYFFIWKVGKWQTIKLPYITLLKKRMATTTFGGRTMISSSEINYVYDITLLSESHLTKKQILRLKDKEQALSTLEKISSLLNVEICQYNPQTTRHK